MNQGKLEVVKQEMPRVNINILGISKLKWTRMGEFNSDDHYIYYCGQEKIEEPSQSTKESEMQYLDVSSECMSLGSLSRHNKDLERRTLKPSAHHSSRVLDRPYDSS